MERFQLNLSIKSNSSCKFALIGVGGPERFRLVGGFNKAIVENGTIYGTHFSCGIDGSRLEIFLGCPCLEKAENFGEC